MSLFKDTIRMKWLKFEQNIINKILFVYSCFTIACKLESRRVPDTNSLLSLFDARHHVTPVILNHGEKQLLTQLDFELG